MINIKSIFSDEKGPVPVTRSKSWLALLEKTLDKMTVLEIREIALGLNGVTEDIKWEDHLCFSVGGKMFLVTSPDLLPSPAAFKVPEGSMEEIIEQEGFTRHQYLGRYGWIHLDDITRLSSNQWSHYIEQSYQLVASKLSKKMRTRLNIQTK